MPATYIGTLHQHHENNIAEVLALINQVVTDAKPDKIRIKFVSFEAKGTTLAKNGKTSQKRFETFMNGYSRFAFPQKLHNFICSVERQCSKGSDNFEIVLMGPGREAIARLELK